MRKSLRECPAEVADETDKALTDFSEYYDVMVETGQRDGFTPAPMSDYSDMIGAFGCRSLPCVRPHVLKTVWWHGRLSP